MTTENWVKLIAAERRRHMILNNVAVELGSRWKGSEYVSSEYFIKLCIPLPGGEAIYEVVISEQMYDNMQLAHKLSEGKRV